jgi:hypothetical protein
MRRKYAIIIALTVLFASVAGWALYLYNKPHRNVAGVDASVRIDAEGLCTGYRKDEAGSDKRFVGKVLDVSGTVVESQLAGNKANIRLGNAAADMAVSCDISIDDSSSFRLPLKGSKVMIKGRCTGMLQDVNLVDCVIK